MLDFTEIVEEYSSDVVIVNRTGGEYSETSGLWTGGDISYVDSTGAVLPLSDDDLENGDGGQYTSESRKIYIHQELKKGQQVIHKPVYDDEGVPTGITYKVVKSKDYSDLANGLRIYTLNRMGESSD